MNEAGFVIERCPVGSGGWEFLATVGADVTAFSDTAVAPGRRYFYRVRAWNGAGDSVFTDIAEATTPDAGPLPGAPGPVPAVEETTSAGASGGAAILPPEAALLAVLQSGASSGSLSRRAAGTADELVSAVLGGSEFLSPDLHAGVLAPRDRRP